MQPDLNTSYVKVQPEIDVTLIYMDNYLNTSYVKVQLISEERSC